MLVKVCGADCSFLLASRLFAFWVAHCTLLYEDRSILIGLPVGECGMNVNMAVTTNVGGSVPFATTACLSKGIKISYLDLKHLQW